MEYNQAMTSPDQSSIAQMVNCFPNDVQTDLAKEFDAWELASDEALENFETDLEIQNEIELGE
jgi:hypothetical protein